MIGRDSFLCGKEEIDIPGSLLEFLHRKGIFFWDGLINKWNGPFPIWYEASCLNMQADIALSWDHIKTKLRNGGFFRSFDHNFLTWRISDRMDSICVKDIYRLLLSEGRQLCNNAFPGIFWKSGCQSKMVFFAWLTFHNKNLTWENLKKRGWLGPGICPLCSSAEEDNLHLFLLCKEAR